MGRGVLKLPMSRQNVRHGKQSITHCKTRPGLQARGSDFLKQECLRLNYVLASQEVEN